MGAGGGAEPCKTLRKGLPSHARDLAGGFVVGFVASFTTEHRERTNIHFQEEQENLTPAS